MSATPREEQMGPRAVCDDAFEKAIKASKEASRAWAEGEDASEPSRAMREQTERFRAARKIVIPDRPTKGWIGLMCRGLGDLADVPLPTQEEFPDARRYRVLPYLSILVPLGFIVVFSLLIPWTMLSPVTATGRAIGGDNGQMIAGQIVTLTLTAVIIVTLAVIGPKRVKQFLFTAALDEELWFRLGAENWTPWRRIRACLQFGIAHLLNLIVAIATLGGLAAVGGIYMWVYLREIRETGDPRRAVIVSAHFHAAYNWGAIMFLFVMAALALTVNIIPLFL